MSIPSTLLLLSNRDGVVRARVSFGGERVGGFFGSRTKSSLNQHSKQDIRLQLALPLQHPVHRIVHRILSGASGSSQWLQDDLWADQQLASLDLSPLAARR